MDIRNISVEYRDFTIRLSHDLKKWSVSEARKDFNSVLSAKEYIDSLLKAEVTETEVLLKDSDYSSTLERVTVTSIDGEGGVWIRRKSRGLRGIDGRKKVNPSCLYVLDESSETVISELERISKKYDNLYNDKENEEAEQINKLVKLDLSRYTKKNDNN